MSSGFLLAMLFGISGAAADALQDYAQECTQATGTTIPDFSCDAGTEVPVTHATAQGTCDKPNRLNRQCDPGSHFQVLTRSDDAYVVAHCRKKGLPNADYGDIAIIQYNRHNGATCFYQALGTLPGEVKSPAKGQSVWPWYTPSTTAGISCGECHDNGPFIRSPYINQVTGPNAVPGSDDFGFNSTQPYAFVGSDFASWKAFKVEIDGNECNGCHRLGANNLGSAGTAIDFGIRATAASETAKNPPSPDSPIWMPPAPVQTAFNAAHAASAKAIHDCAMHVGDTPLPNSAACRITLFAAAFHPVESQPNAIASQFASAQFGLGQQTDVFSIDQTGTLRVAWVVGAGAWHPPVPIGPAGLFPPFAPVTASNQFGLDHQTDVFAVDTSGTLRVAWVVDAGAWHAPVPIGPAGLFPPGAQVAASKQFGLDHQTDVFAVDKTGTLRVAWVVNAGAWNGPVPIGPTGLLPPGAPVTASNQFGLDHQTDVFAVDKTGALRVAWVVNAGAWNGPAPIGPAGLLPPGAPVAASKQFGLDHQTDVFAVDKTGALRVAWVVNAGAWNAPAPIGAGRLFPPGAAMTASNQFGLGHQTDVFAVDKTGALEVAWVVDAGAWHGPVSIGPAGRFTPGASIAASNQFGLGGQTDLFGIDKSGVLSVSWVVNAGAWNGPAAIH